MLGKTKKSNHNCDLFCTIARRVTHLGTDQDQVCLTLVIIQEPVFQFDLAISQHVIITKKSRTEFTCKYQSFSFKRILSLFHMQNLCTFISLQITWLKDFFSWTARLCLIIKIYFKMWLKANESKKKKKDYKWIEAKWQNGEKNEFYFIFGLFYWHWSIGWRINQSLWWH